ncbi:MAG: site-2 protease family protein [Nanoarchaeota archaeon]
MIDLMNFIKNIGVLDIISILFLLLLAFIIYKNKKDLTIEGPFIMWRTKWGIKLMDRLAKPLRKNKILFNSLLISMFFVSIISLIYIVYYLTEHTIKLLTKQTDIPGISLVIPGLTSIGSVHVPFWTILIIFIVAAIHEFGHGLLARVWKMKIKSTGLVLLAIIPGAFVEIDEKELEKRPLKEKLSVLMAGPFFNIVLAILSFGLILLVSKIPVTYNGIYFQSYNNSQLTNGTLLEINNKPIIYNNFYQAYETIEEEIKNKSSVKIIYLDNKGKLIEKNVSTIKVNNETKLGIYLSYSCELSTNKAICKIKDSLSTFLMFLFMFNLGIGLANLLPLIPLDGGKIAYFLIGKYKWLFALVNLFILALILLNLLYPLYKRFLF